MRDEDEGLGFGETFSVGRGELAALVGVEGNQVDLARHSCCELQQALSILDGVIHAPEHDVLKKYLFLPSDAPGELFPQSLHEFFNVVLTIHRHNPISDVVGRPIQADLPGKGD
jgi:hypothetical protein